MDRENRVVMIVRASRPGTPSGNNGTFQNRDNMDAIAINMGPMDADAWRQQQFQRQRMQLLSMAIFLCFMVLFFDNRASDPRQNNRNRLDSTSHNRHGADGQNETERLDKIQDFEKLLRMQPGYDAAAMANNISGIYSGSWSSLTADDYEKTKPKYTDIVPYLKIDRDMQVQQFTQPVEVGHTWLLLKMKPPAAKELSDDVSYVKGQLVIYEEQASLAATILPVQGVFFRKMGKLTLFGNSPDSTVQVLYKKADAPSNRTKDDDLNQPLEPPAKTDDDTSFQPHLRLGAMNLGEIDGVPMIENREDYESIDISPPRYSYVSRFRSSDSFSDQCVSVVEMTLVNDTTTAVPKGGEGELSLNNAKLTGTLASVNCGLYLKIETTFQEENLNVFFSKASHYAVIMTFIAMGEIYFLLRQLQITNTQATAAKVSLLTIGQQAIVDSYLCLGHLTVGIVAQNVFTAFASVAFVKLIIFSVFEMRYLLIIWKARRPQGFADGWLTLRRELTTLYSRFYLSLLGGLAIFYNFSSHLPLLVFICYSFWVPQIVHNVHREVRNPFDLGYLYGISALRMFLPLYFYGCPDNFLTAFPMYESKPDISFCYTLSFWMALQVGILVLQQRFGPRFFIPARFLPVKYNYERRINQQEVSLLHTATNDEGTIDCVICMVELDISARDYMIAPCDHIFHRECLQGWMGVKMECPTCRCALPEP
ncbi:hypothetical protein Poli38472_012092 [Pythium oligandrum]|uniref:RING-type E3 ubiquitin transferase n=1 Tax=Pythium oligandrum TaxID=41045 RepID=A0A8K1FLC5_PYTOL|nr:hypothetical protein Poli38472_012092 [Pythium oligandrum]|eukprot:TMW66976.1 hypothetical protein Poli38472_012092 [Pythium oligandrum]